jgi:hypothetical protein
LGADVITRFLNRMILLLADRASSATLTARLVEARVLEGSRQRELGIDSSQALAQARSLAVAVRRDLACWTTPPCSTSRNWCPATRPR